MKFGNFWRAAPHPTLEKSDLLLLQHFSYIYYSIMQTKKIPVHLNVTKFADFVIWRESRGTQTPCINLYRLLNLRKSKKKFYKTAGAVGITWSVIWLLVVKNQPSKDKWISKKELQYIIENTETTPRKHVSTVYYDVLSS